MNDDKNKNVNGNATPSEDFFGLNKSPVPGENSDSVTASGTNDESKFTAPRFVVNFDDDDDSLLDVYDDETAPRYKGEVYFSNRASQNRYQPENEPAVPASANSGQNSVKPTRSPSAKSQVKHKKKRKKSKIGGTTFSFIFISAICLVTIVASVVAISFINDVLAINRKDQVVSVNIPDDATTNQIIDILSENDLIKQKALCKLYFKGISIFKNLGNISDIYEDEEIREEKGKSGALKEALAFAKTLGEYEYIGGMYYVNADIGLEGMLLKFRQIQVETKTIELLFPEGWSIYQIFKKLDEFDVCEFNYLIDALEKSDFSYDFVGDIKDSSDRTFLLEGYMFPDTYEFFEDSDANTVIRVFLSNFEKKWTEEYAARAEELGLTMDEVITIASIIQREAADKDQMKKISSVVHNRLNHPASYPTLGMDSTVNYITSFASPYVSAQEKVLFTKTYDTSSVEGLPPGPICNPGVDAIEAALYPDDTDYYFFRHDKYGGIYMAKTFAEHRKNGLEVLRVNQ